MGNGRRDGTRARPNGSIAISASCCRSCGWRCPGVQVLFAFLLAVPFQQNFTKITQFEKDVYFATLLLTAISAILLIAPSAYHRSPSACSRSAT